MSSANTYYETIDLTKTNTKNIKALLKIINKYNIKIKSCSSFNHIYNSYTFIQISIRSAKYNELITIYRDPPTLIHGCSEYDINGDLVNCESSQDELLNNDLYSDLKTFCTNINKSNAELIIADINDSIKISITNMILIAGASFLVAHLISKYKLNR